MHIYRLVMVGQAQREGVGSSCIGGELRLKSQHGDVVLCGENERYSPPVVTFLDCQDAAQFAPSFTVSVDNLTVRTQFLVHFSFTQSKDLPRVAVSSDSGGGN